MKPDHGTLTYLMHLAAKLGSPRLGTQVLEQMGNSDLQYHEHHLASLLQAFAMSGDLKGAFGMLQIIDSEGISTRKETALPIIHQLGTNVGSIEKAIQLLKELHSEGKGVHVAGFNGVLYAASRVKRIDMVKNTFALAPLFGIKPNVETYNCLLDASIYASDWQYGNEVWTLMQSTKVKPNSLSYSKMVVLCCTQDDYEDCFRYLEEMKYFKFAPPRGCYQQLIKKLAMAGDDRVHTAIEDMRAAGYIVPEQIERLVSSRSAANVEEVSRRLGAIDDHSVAAQ
jgi:pentatricopeptide repeat protein